MTLTSRQVHNAHRLRALPDSPGDRELMEDCARQHAATVATEAGTAAQTEFLRLRLGATEQYGIDYPHLDEIMYVPSIARVPCAPPFIRGIVNRRGEPLALLDLKHFFRLVHDEPYGEDARIVVVRGAELRVGILVNEVLGNETYTDRELAPTLPSTGMAKPEYIRGIFHGRVAMLDMDALLGDPELVVNDSVG